MDPSGPPVQGSSKQRFRAYLASRGADARAPASGAAAAGARDWTVEPPAHGARRAHRGVWTLIREFLKLLRGHWGRVVVALSTLTVVSLLALAMPLSTKFVFDYIIGDTPGPAGIPSWLGLPTDRHALLWLTGGALVALAAFNAAVGTIGRYQMTRLAQRVRVAVRKRVFEHMARLPLHRLAHLKSGGISSILREDAGLVGEMLFSVIYNPLRALITFAGGLAALAFIDWRMLLGGVLLVPAVYFSHRAWIGRIRPVHRAIKANRQHGDAHATEAFAGIRVVRSFDRTRGEALRFVNTTHLMTRQEMLVWRWSRTIEIVWVILVPVASAAVLVYGGSRVLAHQLTIGDVAAFSAYLLMLLGPLEVLVSTAASLQNGLAGWDRCLDVLAEPAELGGQDEAAVRRAGASAEAEAGTLIKVTKAGSPGHLALRAVTFAYPASAAGATPRAVLSGITLDIPAGRTVALVGPSGSGKTTLCNLVARFHDPTSGAIELDGLDLRRIDVRSYRRLLGIVEQDVFLFDGTVADNIAYARREASRDEVVRAAQHANAHGFITAMERGYDTLIGERGVRLSGGQKQRIAIARAVLADPRILILDEATSNLDSESERLIQASLTDLMRGRTCLVIAHRLSTIRHADLIVVLEDGRIIETGTHEELEARGGRYADMLRVQLAPPAAKPAHADHGSAPGAFSVASADRAVGAPRVR